MFTRSRCMLRVCHPTGLAATVAVLVALGTPAGVDAAPPSVQLRAGASVPTHDMADALDPGGHLGFGVTWRPDTRTTAGLELNYHWLGEKTAQVEFLGPMTIRQKSELFEGAAFVQVALTSHDRTVPPTSRAV